jgi:hypothetical protein
MLTRTVLEGNVNEFEWIKSIVFFSVSKSMRLRVE